ncbi:MAG: hypothetical protein IJL52_00280 [Clostridia bacterium]|nr:hypothetical protein [Clostridia bacterium]
MKPYVIICIALLAALLLLSACGTAATPQEATNADADMTNAADVTDADPWAAITEDGVDEEAFFAALDQTVLTEVAQKLQTAVDEEAAAEEANPELFLTEGWIRIFDSPQYRDVLALGKEAMPALYWIVYKSDRNGLYEFVCANALYELSGYDFTIADGVRQWDNAKALLPLFNQKILEERL